MNTTRTINTTKTQTTVALGAAAALLLGFAMIAPAGAATSDEVPSLVVHYDPQSLATDDGARVVYEKSWISHLSVDPVLHESETEEGTYYTSNYRGAKGRINFHIDAGVGTVHIRSGSLGD